MLKDTAHLSWLISRSRATETRLAPRSSSLSHPGDRGKRVRVLVSGWAFRYQTLLDGRRQIIEILLPGDVIGLETLFGAITHTSIQASTAVIYMTLDADDLSQAFETSGEFRARVMEMLGEQLAALQGMIVGLGQCNAEERTGALLGDLYTRLQACGLTTDRSYILELTQHELADVLGLHLIHLQRVLTRLRTRALISLEKRRVTLLDIQGLADMTPWIKRTDDVTRDMSWLGSAATGHVQDTITGAVIAGKQRV